MMLEWAALLKQHIARLPFLTAEPLSLLADVTITAAPGDTDHCITTRIALCRVTLRSLLSRHSKCMLAAAMCMQHFMLDFVCSGSIDRNVNAMLV